MKTLTSPHPTPHTPHPGLKRDLAILALLWLIAGLVDLTWLGLDRSVPAWDQGDHLTRALNYWRVLQHPQWLSGEWWTELWRQSISYRAPFVYLVTVPLLTGLGRGFDQAVMVNLIFTAVLLATVYALGRHLFDRQTGLWAAGMCLVIPEFVFIRTDYLLDYGLTACIIFTFTCLTRWRDASEPTSSWGWSLGFGLGLGLSLLSKPTSLMFLLIPILWALLETVISRQWFRLVQLGLAFAIGLLICGFWIQINWLTILTSSSKSNATWIPEGVTPGDPLSAWTYYWRVLPYMVSRPLLWISLGSWLAGIVTALLGWRKTPRSTPALTIHHRRRVWLWLFGFILGCYCLLSLLQNKDPRHILPYSPVVLLVLARGLTLWRSLGGACLRWGTVSFTGLLVAASIFPLPGAPHLEKQRLPDRGEPWPHSEIMAEVVRSAPYLRSTLGVIPNLRQLNPMNLDFYGALQDFRVYSREVSFNADYADLDARSLVWFITKSGEQGPQGSHAEAKKTLQSLVEQSQELAVKRTWELPDGSELRLYRRQIAPVTVKPLNQVMTQVTLETVLAPAQAAPGVAIPVTYNLIGPWKDLQDGLLLLTWQGETQDGQGIPESWIHDHAIGLGHLYTGLEPQPPEAGFEVTEQLAMLPATDLSPGVYELKATYLNRKTGETYSLTGTTAKIRIDGDSNNAIEAPELDLATQLRQLALGLPLGELDAIFTDTGRINQYDPIQDYLVQVEQSLTYRLQQAPDNLEWLYGLSLAQVLQQKADGAIATLTHVAEVDPTNPYQWAYLGFVHLYRFQPKQAQQALDRAEQLDPHLPNLQLLQTVAAALQLNLPKTWRLLKDQQIL
ncbi:MAG: glycosyltransferase family 39 protein [Pseudanabaenales cyanobacterium]|nr:glycosyltransferase family 39 protein [Pseudanabaenales cyanobacterium]